MAPEEVLLADPMTSLVLKVGEKGVKAVFQHIMKERQARAATRAFFDLLTFVNFEEAAAAADQSDG